MASSESPVISSSRKKLDLSTVGGLGLALVCILGGLLLEGGRLSDIGQVTAAMIVVGGTIGAVMVTTPISTLTSAVKKLPSVLWHETGSTEVLLQDIIRFAVRARRSGLTSLESDAEQAADPFFSKALLLAIDGTDLKVVRQIMELEIDANESRGEAEAKVFEAAGGYAPTVGIIGAVLGLIQVMKHLEDIGSVGHGIAVAFVATVYGVAAANLLFLPVANKLKARLHQSIRLNEMALEGVISVAEGLNPKLIESKLECFKDSRAGSPERKQNLGGRRPAQTAAA